MADQWYFAWDNHNFGPFTATQLKGLAALGRLQPGDAVWKDAREKGMLAANVKNLFADAQARAVPTKACPPAPAQLACEAHAPSGLPSSPSHAGAMLQPYVVAILDKRTPEEQLRETIPDGLTLRELPD
jgi:hypothetical protein